MSSSSSIGISTMKPCCRILISYKDSSIFGVSPHRTNRSATRNLSKPQFKSIYRRSYSSSRILGSKASVGSNRRAFCVSDMGLTQYRNLSSISCVHNNIKGSKRGILVIPRVASDFRNQSTSVEAHVNEKGFERIYVQGGLNVKPLVIEKFETGLDIVKEQEGRVDDHNTSVTIDDFTGLNERKDRELPEIEKEAWKLLRSAVVNYCGAPVGTVAANDPADKQPLNYDQIFIRDFVPSALAFLLNGEGEIVKNFLLHTLQLQVLPIT